MTKIKRRHLGALSGLLVFLAVFAVACGGEPTPVPTTAAAPQAGGPEAMSMMMEKMGPEDVRAMMGEMMPQVMEKMGPDGVAAMMAEMMPQMMEAMGPENMAMMMEKMQPGGMAKMEGSRLDTVKKRGKLICASRNDVPGYGSLDASGNNVGFDIDLCRAVASAVLGDPKAIEIRYISASERGRPSSRAKWICLSAPLPGQLLATPNGATTSRRCSSTDKGSWSIRPWVYPALWSLMTPWSVSPRAPRRS